MTKRRDQGPDLFDWGAAQAEAVGAFDQPLQDDTPPIGAGQKIQPSAAPLSEGMAIMATPAARNSEPEPTIARSECKGSVADCPVVADSELAPVVDFRERREKLPRFILHPMRDLDCMDRWIDRKHGRLAPAPILAFATRGRPPDPGDNGPPLSRVG